MKDTIVIRAFVPLEETDAFLKDKDRVQKYFEEKYGDCSVIHDQHDTTDRQHRHEVVLQFLDPAVANKVKQKYNGRVLFGACTTTTFLTPPQTKNLRSSSDKRKRPKSLTPQAQYGNVTIKTERGRSRDRRGREMSESRGPATPVWQPSGGLERKSRDREVQQHEDEQRYSSATPDMWDSRRSETRMTEFDHQRCPSSSPSCDGREPRRMREMDSLQRHAELDHQRYASSDDGRELRRMRELERHSDHQHYPSESRKSRRSREMEMIPDLSQRYVTSIEGRDPKRPRETDALPEPDHRSSYSNNDGRRRSRELDDRESRRSRESETYSEPRYPSSALTLWSLTHQSRRPQQQPPQNIFERLDKPQQTREHSANYYAGEAVIVHDRRRPRGKKRPAFSPQVGHFHKRRNTRSPARSDRGSVNSPALSSSSSERVFFDSRPSDSTASESPLIIIDELSQTPPSSLPPTTSSVSSSPQPRSLSPPPSPIQSPPPSLLDIPFPSPPRDTDKPHPQATQPSSSQLPTAAVVSQPIIQASLPTYLSISPPLSSPIQTSPILVPMPISYPAAQGYQYQFFPPFYPTQVYSWPYTSQVTTTAVVPSTSSRLARSRSGTPVLDEPKDNNQENDTSEEKEKLSDEAGQTEETSVEQTDDQTPPHIDKEITQVDSETDSHKQTSVAKMIDNDTCSDTQETESHAQEVLTEETETRTQMTDVDTDFYTPLPDAVMQQTEPHSEDDTDCQSNAVQTLEQPVVQTDAQSEYTHESHSQTITDDVIVPISPASCPEQASEPSHTDNEQSSAVELAIPTNMTDVEIEEAMEEEEDNGIDDDQESMSSEEFSPLTFQKTPADVNYNLLKERYMKDYHEKAQILATSCEVLLSHDPSMEDHVVKMLESSVKNLARKLLDQFREEAGITLD